jgi:predicted O-methyltransferase YrrM
VALVQRTAGKVYSDDPFFKGRLGISYGKWIAYIHRWRIRSNNLTFIEGLSQDVAHNFDEEIDLLFIDADHSYNAVKQDWVDWCPKLKDRALIVLHDAMQTPTSSYLGSMQFYSEHVRKPEQVELVDSVNSMVILRVCR